MRHPNLVQWSPVNGIDGRRHVRHADDGSQILVVIHRFAASSSEWIEVPTPEGEHYEIADVFADGHPDIRRTHDQLSCRLDDDFSAMCVLLQQR